MGSVSTKKHVHKVVKEYVPATWPTCLVDGCDGKVHGLNACEKCGTEQCSGCKKLMVGGSCFKCGDWLCSECPALWGSEDGYCSNCCLYPCPESTCGGMIQDTVVSGECNVCEAYRCHSCGSVGECSCLQSKRPLDFKWGMWDLTDQFVVLDVTDRAWVHICKSGTDIYRKDPIKRKQINEEFFENERRRAFSSHH